MPASSRPARTTSRTSLPADARERRASIACRGRRRHRESRTSHTGPSNGRTRCRRSARRQAAARPTQKSVRGNASVQTRCRVDVGNERQRSRLQQQYAPTERTCTWCGRSFAPEYGDLHTRFCSNGCRVEQKHHESGIRKGCRRLGCAYEVVHPLAVFERDKWRCQLCGVRTPPTKRGTIQPNAPELDHIIPLKQHGPHSYLNVQCACRRCNRKKGARARGQLLLVG